MTKLVWHNESRKIKSLVATEGNPRQLTKKQAKDLEQSLKKFNLVDIPAINTDNRIISGHQRVAILKALGREEEEIDVRVPNRQLTEEEHREYMLRANKNLGEWNMDLLANFDESLLKEVGFDVSEILKEQNKILVIVRSFLRKLIEKTRELECTNLNIKLFLLGGQLCRGVRLCKN